MGSGVRSSPGPPTNILIPNNLNMFCTIELTHGTQPRGRNSKIYTKRLEYNWLALISYEPDLALAIPVDQPRSPHDFQVIDCRGGENRGSPSHRGGKRLWPSCVFGQYGVPFKVMLFPTAESTGSEPNERVDP